ncbi:MAG: polyphosphate kinase 2 family protein, partial [Afipia sp.]|nr:polyphosphate kinase 2 family protein [Afipia sp.]
MSGDELNRSGRVVVHGFRQRDRLLARLDNPDKHWKFNVSDLDERARWADYEVAFEAMP